METTDLFFASYLKLKEYNLLNFEKVSKYKNKFVFEMTEEEWKNEKISYNNSDVIKIKQIIEGLKDLSF